METKYFPAIFEAGKLCPLEPLDLEEHERVEVAVLRASASAKASGKSAPPKHRVELPLVRSNRPGTLDLTAERVAQLLEEDDLSG